MTGPATGPPPAVRPAPSGEPVAARRPPRGLVRWAVALLVSGAILAYLFAAQGVDPRALVPLVRAISVPGLAGLRRPVGGRPAPARAPLPAPPRPAGGALAARAGDRSPQHGRRLGPGAGGGGGELSLSRHRPARFAPRGGRRVIRALVHPRHARRGAAHRPGALGGGKLPAATGRAGRRQPRDPGGLGGGALGARAAPPAGCGGSGTPVWPRRSRGAAPPGGGRRGGPARARADPRPRVSPVPAPPPHEVWRVLLPPAGAPGLAGRRVGESRLPASLSLGRRRGDGRVAAAARPS